MKFWMNEHIITWINVAPPCTRRVKEECKQTECVKTIAGRRRNFPSINSKNHEVGGLAVIFAAAGI
jgi:uncharacterized protein YaeQ